MRLAVALGFGVRLKDATWVQVYAVSLLCGIGFTMSPFMGSLAFTDPPALEGYALLRLAPRSLV